MSVEIEIEYQTGLRTTAHHVPSESTLHTEATVANGGTGGAFTPTDLLATALGSCILTIVGKVAERDGLDVSGLKIKAVKHMTDEPSRRIGRIHLTVTWPESAQISDDQKIKLVRAGRACPVCVSLSPDIKVEIDWST
jgi:putative redox protein